MKQVDENNINGLLSALRKSGSMKPNKNSTWLHRNRTMSEDKTVAEHTFIQDHTVATGHATGHAAEHAKLSTVDKWAVIQRQTGVDVTDAQDQDRTAILSLEATVNALPNFREKNPTESSLIDNIITAATKPLGIDAEVVSDSTAVGFGAN